ncbi:hypothetical protein K1X84_11620 [bacterium]|nr:hypothetical protein [bacterium]
MNVITKLSSSLGRRDEIPNQQLAQSITNKKDRKAVKELVTNLDHDNRSIQNDCIKVLYEIGEKNPSLIAGYVKVFLTLLTHKNNRLQWGAMTALNSITLENPRIIYNSLAKIIASADQGSVITKDQLVNILIKLCGIKQYSGAAFSLLLEQLLKSPTNQLPMYAEKAIPIVTHKNQALFVKVLISRLDDFQKETKRKRVEKIIKKFNKLNEKQ